MNRSWNWARLVLGVLAVGLGILAYAWPGPTLKVVGFLFGLNLLLTGVTRTLLLIFNASGYPALYRVLGILLGIAVAVIGVLCLNNIPGSLKLLLVVVAIGWILEGVAEILLAVFSGGERNGWRIALGVCALLGGIAILVWPGLGLATFLFLGATTVVFVGLLLIISAIFGLRTRTAATV